MLQKASIRFASLTLIALMSAGCLDTVSEGLGFSSESSGVDEDAAAAGDGEDAQSQPSEDPTTSEEPSEEPAEETSPPRMSFSKDNHERTLTVISTPSGEDQVDWSDLDVTNCATVPTGSVNPGDEMEECEGDVKITHKPSMTLLYQTEF